MSEPIPVQVTRYRCPTCTRTTTSRARTREHMTRCWLDPENRGCKRWGEMATVQIVRSMLECDECGELFGAPMGWISPTEARAAAFADGWRFPNQLTAKGTPAATTSDACPNCAPSWVARRRSARRRIALKAELEAVADKEAAPDVR